MPNLKWMPNTFDMVAKRAVRALRDAHVEDAATDARILLCAAANFSHVDLISQAYDEVPSGVLEKFNASIDRRLAHEPIAYILGEKAFWSLTFIVNEHVLIPRPETEGVVERGLELMRKVERPAILDIGTGTGAILMSMLSERDDASGMGVDISVEALSVAKQNAANFGVKNRCSFLQSDYLQNVSGQYDLLVSNPPYITEAAMGDLAKNVKAYEPDLALRGGEDGLEAYRQITEQARRVLTPGGYLVYEIGYDQGDAVCALLASAGYTEITCLKDLAGHDRVISAKI